ncbi:adenosylcobinamide-GDP ribazoletransferase, partial [Ilumatobacter sp.]|uniref:adenosylcobinamide-GDP ribazoletransferase n=1 Tax=Ilumatobacter sp. TaxID=1967498 RepID=UPI003C3A69BF
ALGWWVVPLAAAVAIGTAAITLIALRAFGGVSGDILGAVEQVGECVVLIVVSGLALRHPLWWA